MYLEENEILLTGYTGNSTEIKIPNTYTIDGVTYNVVILSYVDLYFEQSGGGGGSPKGMSSSYNKDISAKPLNYSINTRYNSKLIVKDNEEEDYYYPCWGYGLLNYNPTVEVIELGENILGVYINAYDGYCDYGVIDYAFQNDSSLVNVPVIPSASSSYGTFEGCTNLAGTIRFYDCSPNFLDSINPSTVENEIVLEIPSDSAVTEFLSELNASLAENYPNMSITTFENDSCPVDSGGGGGDTGK